MARPRKQTLGLVRRIAEPDAVPAILLPPRVEVDDHHDDLAVLMAIVRHMGFDYALGAAMEALAQASTQTGTERRASVEKARRHLEEEIAHLDRQ